MNNECRSARPKHTCPLTVIRPFAAATLCSLVKVVPGSFQELVPPECGQQVVGSSPEVALTTGYIEQPECKQSSRVEKRCMWWSSQARLD